jgi:polar amino acid transport system substrate-binding protein
MTSRSRHLSLAVVALAALLGLGGCGGSSDPEQRVALTSVAVPPAPTSPSPSDPVCQGSNVPKTTASLTPPATIPARGQMPAGTYMAQIQKRGRLIAGVDANTLGLSYVNPQTGQFEGAEIDLVRELAKAIFGDTNNRVEFRALTTDQRLGAVTGGSVDVVVDAYTITCGRQTKVDFSTVYYDAGQRVLVPMNSPATSIADLNGKKVCATKGSTTLKNLQKNYKAVDAVSEPQRSDCLVDLQEDTVDAISSDDTILLSMQAQDPYTKVIGPRMSAEPYGIAIAKSHSGFVRFVNGVLAQLRSDGRLSSIFRSSLGAAASAPPQPQYAG